MFIDRARITIKSGKGGDGAVSFRREPFVPDGGPDGGNGGDGGHVIFIVDDSLRTLMDFKYKKHYAAENGQDGMRRKRFGKRGEDMVIKVPPGTLVIDEKTGTLMKDLVHTGDRLMAAKGGKGGRGNINYVTSVRQAPNFAEAGGFATERAVILELKLIADVGLVGFPNVGKSTLLSGVTGANPKIGNYHFTTTTPNLGVVELYDTSFVIADIPGLIEGAANGAGLGHDFLKHIERTKVIIHVIDVSGSEGRDPFDDYQKINEELREFTEKLICKPQLIAANKIDILGEESEEYQGFKRKIEDLELRVFPISAAGRTGLSELMKAAAGELVKAEKEQKSETGFENLEHFNFDTMDNDPEYRDIRIEKDKGVYVLEGRQLQKIFNSTNFQDMGSIRYLYKYLEKQGVTDRLKDMGIEDGDTVRMYGFEFDFIEERSSELKE